MFCQIIVLIFGILDPGIFERSLEMFELLEEGDGCGYNRCYLLRSQ